MGLIAIPPGHVGTVVTHLEMTVRPAPMPEVPASPLRIERRAPVDLDGYRRLFRRVGARWLWYSRLAMDDAALAAAIGELHVVHGPGGEECGLIELDFPAGGACLVRFLGLVPEWAGRGHGRWLLACLLRLGWREGVERIALHTCTLDHPAALPAYLRAGFVATRRAFERFPDPRLAGLLPRDCAPQVPILP